MRGDASRWLAVGAVFLDAVGVDLQRVVVDGEAAFLGDAGLAFFDFGVEELLDLAALQADQMIVVVALVEFEHRLVAVEVVAHQQPGLLELGEHAVDRGETDILAFVRQQPVHLLCGHVALVALLEQIEDFQARQRGLETDALEIGRIAQWGLQNGNTNTL